MKKIVRPLILSSALVLLFSCASINLPVAATSNELGRKVGYSSGTIWFGLFGKADASIEAACINGRITKISTVDLEKQIGFLGMFVEYTCTVTGE